jgi:hypothetical protein
MLVSLARFGSSPLLSLPLYNTLHHCACINLYEYLEAMACDDYILEYSRATTSVGRPIAVRLYNPDQHHRVNPTLHSSALSASPCLLHFDFGFLQICRALLMWQCETFNDAMGTTRTHAHWCELINARLMSTCRLQSMLSEQGAVARFGQLSQRTNELSQGDY